MSVALATPSNLNLPPQSFPLATEQGVEAFRPGDLCPQCRSSPIRHRCRRQDPVSPPGAGARPATTRWIRQGTGRRHRRLPWEVDALNPANTAMRPMPNHQAASDIPIKLTPITGRVSRAKKGVPVHTCDTCKPPKVRAEIQFPPLLSSIFFALLPSHACARIFLAMGLV